MPGEEVVAAMHRADSSVCGVLATEKVGVRKAGMTYLVTIHVQADPTLSSRDAHILTGNVEGEARAGAPQVASVLFHMEPFGESSAKFGDSGTSARAS